MRFPFVELTFTHALGPAPGRYVVRGEGEHAPAPRPDDHVIGPTLPVGSADVLAIRVEGAPVARRRLLRASRPRDDAPGAAPAEASLCVATHVRATRALPDRDAAQRELERWRAGGAQALVDDAVAVVNRAIRAFRAAAADPYLSEVTRADPRTTRVGYGTSEVVDGTWEAALLLPATGVERVSHARRLLPTEIVADVLAGRRRILDGEDVLLRAVLDIEQGRPEIGAQQLALALGALAAEPGGPGAALAPLAAELAAVRERLPGPAALAELCRLAGAAGDAVDAWRVAGSGQAQTSG